MGIIQVNAITNDPEVRAAMMGHYRENLLIQMKEDLAREAHSLMEEMQPKSTIKELSIMSSLDNLLSRTPSFDDLFLKLTKKQTGTQSTVVNSADKQPEYKGYNAIVTCGSNAWHCASTKVR